MADPTLRRAPHVLSEIVRGRAMLVTKENMELIALNPVGTLVWEALADPVERGALVDYVLERVTGADRERVEADVASFVAELDDLGLVVEG